MSDPDGLVLLSQSDRSEILEPFWLYFCDESCLYSKFDGLVALELRTSSLTNLLILRSFTCRLFLSYSDIIWASYPGKRFLFRYLLLSPQSLEREGFDTVFYHNSFSSDGRQFHPTQMIQRKVSCLIMLTERTNQIILDVSNVIATANQRCALSAHPIMW